MNKEKSKSEVEVEQRNLADSTLSEAERHEAATEEPATVGCPSLGIPKLPGGFDGVEPGVQGGEGVPPSQNEARAKLEQSVIRMRAKLTQIADLALAAEAKSGSEHVKLGSKYMENSKAIAEIRRICKLSLVEEVVPDYGWLAKIVTSDHFDPECLAKAIEAEASKRQVISTAKNAKSTKTLATFAFPAVKNEIRETASPLSPDEQSERDRALARKLRKIHWKAYPTKVDICTMGKTEQNGKVYEVRIAKRGDSKVKDTYGQVKVNGKTVITCSFIGSAWMLNRILTEGTQALVNYKAKRKRDSRRNYKRRDAAKAAGEGK